MSFLKIDDLSNHVIESAIAKISSQANIIYHAVVHESMLEKFLLKIEKDVNVYRVSFLRNEHFHLIIWSKNEIDNDMDFCLELIKNEIQGFFLLRNFIPCECRHNFVCNVKFTAPSLKDASMTCILNNLNYLHDMQHLKIPKLLLRDLFNKSSFSYPLIKFNVEAFEIDFERFSQLDSVFDKEYMVWFQNERHLNIRNKAVVTVFFSDAKKTLKLCLKCIQFYMGNDDYFRFYTLYNNWWVVGGNVLVQNPFNWCCVCKRVPLFQLLSTDQLVKQYNLNVDSSPLKYCMKMDFYKNGVKVTSEINEDRFCDFEEECFERFNKS